MDYLHAGNNDALIGTHDSRGPPSKRYKAVSAEPISSRKRVYCSCKKSNRNQKMVLCDGPNCPHEWFHFSCVGLQSNPTGPFYCCDKCKKDRLALSELKHIDEEETDAKLSDVEEEEDKWCSCKGKSSGDMIKCSRENCTVKWYHLECVGLKEYPKTTWICPICDHEKITCTSNNNAIIQNQQNCFCEKPKTNGPVGYCMGPNCAFEWIHFECVGQKSIPGGPFYCCDKCEKDYLAVNKSVKKITEQEVAVVAVAEFEDYKYCFCEKNIGGEMVECSRDNCKYQWYHLVCVRLKEVPEGDWFCWTCTDEIQKSNGKNGTTKNSVLQPLKTSNKEVEIVASAKNVEESGDEEYCEIITPNPSENALSIKNEVLKGKTDFQPSNVATVEMKTIEEHDVFYLLNIPDDKIDSISQHIKELGGNIVDNILAATKVLFYQPSKKMNDKTFFKLLTAAVGGRFLLPLSYIYESHDTGKFLDAFDYCTLENLETKFELDISIRVAIKVSISFRDLFANNGLPRFSSQTVLFALPEDQYEDVKLVLQICGACVYPFCLNKPMDYQMFNFCVTDGNIQLPPNQQLTILRVTPAKIRQILWNTYDEFLP